MTVATAKAPPAAPAIRPFTIDTPEADLDDLRARIRATRWPEKETVADNSQGPRLETMQKLARYWLNDYDWRKVENKLKALPNLITRIDGLDIHFIHVRSKHEDALPLIVNHGWPGSVIEQLKIIDPLTNPTAHGASASDAFHLVIPSMPGYGYSGKPTTTGWGPERIARAWAELMNRLGYDRYVAQGGDWGGQIVDLPHFVTEIDGLDIHFIHVRSEHEDALPLLVSHGWPGSVIEQLKIIEPLTNPTAHGASAADAFHLVIPSMPGYGFSGKPAATGWALSTSRVPGQS